MRAGRVAASGSVHSRRSVPTEHANLPHVGRALTIGGDRSTRATETSTMQIATARPGTTRVGFIGTGVMGQSMCRHLITAGYSTTVYSRTKSKSQPLLDAG